MHDEHHGQHAFARRVATAAAELPIEVVLAMVMEGLDLFLRFCDYRQRWGPGSHARALEVMRRMPRPLLSHFSKVIHDFVEANETITEDAAAALSSAIALAVDTSPLAAVTKRMAGGGGSSIDERSIGQGAVQPFIRAPQRLNAIGDSVGAHVAGDAFTDMLEQSRSRNADRDERWRAVSMDVSRSSEHRGSTPDASAERQSKRYYEILAKIRAAFETPVGELIGASDASAPLTSPRSDTASNRSTFDRKDSVTSASYFANHGSQSKSGSPVLRSLSHHDASGLSPACRGVPESLFCEFIAPALTLSMDAATNRRFVARTNVSSSGFITWEAFSNFFVKIHGDIQEENTSVQFVTTMGDEQHNATVRKLLFSRTTMGGPSLNAAMDRYCLSAGYDGTVHMWETSFYDHACRLHYIPSANKARRWVNDMTYTAYGRLAIAQSRGALFVYSVMNPLKPYLHRAFRSGSALSEDEESAVRVEIERVRMQQGKTRFSAAELPQAEMCVLSSSLPGDVRTIHGPPRAAKFAHMGHVEPLLVGLDTGLVHLYNVFKPIEFRAQVHPMFTYHGFARADVHQVMDVASEQSLLCTGTTARGTSAIHLVDYEKSEPQLILQSRHSSNGHPTAAFTRFDFDDSLGLIVASGAMRSATIFSTTFPDPVTVLSDHSAPLVGAAINAAQYQIFTFTEDHTFHLFDIRMFRKLQAFTDTQYGQSACSSVHFGAGAFDGTRGVAVAASSVPVALVLHQQHDHHGGAAAKAAGGSATEDLRRRGVKLSPSQLATELRHVEYCGTYDALIAAEGNYLVFRTGEDRMEQDLATPLQETVIDFALDAHERRTGALLQGRQCAVVSTVGGNRLLKWDLSEIDAADEGTCICFAFRSAAIKDALVVVIGTSNGDVHLYDLTEEGAHMFSVHVDGCVVCVNAASATGQRVLIGTASGDVHFLSIETRIVTKVFDFETSHCLIRDSLEFGVKEDTQEAALEARKRQRADSLVAFRTRSYTAMDRAVELIVNVTGDSSLTIILYGSGLLIFSRVSHAEVLPLLEFASVESITSGSAVAAIRVGYTPSPESASSPGAPATAATGGGEQLIAVGDFNGNVTLFHTRKVARTAYDALRQGGGGKGRPRTSNAQSVRLGAQSIGPTRSSPFSDLSTVDTMRYDASTAIAPTEDANGSHIPPSVFADYEVTLECRIPVSTKSLVSDVSFVSNPAETLAVGLSEELAIVLLNYRSGVVLSVLSSEPSMLGLDVGSRLGIHEPGESHPFYASAGDTGSHDGSQSNRTNQTHGSQSSNTTRAGASAAALGSHREGSQCSDGGWSPKTPFSDRIAKKHRQLSPSQLIDVGNGGTLATSSERGDRLVSFMNSGGLGDQDSSSAGDGASHAFPAKPQFRMPKGSTHVLAHSNREVASAPASPRGMSDVVFPASAAEVSTKIRLGCNDYHVPARGLTLDEPRRWSPRKDGPTSVTARPVSAKSTVGVNNGPSIPAPPPQCATSARPSSASVPSSTHRNMTFNPILKAVQRPHETPQKPLVHYSQLKAHPAILTSDLDRVRPPTYASAATDDAPSTPLFPYQRKTAEMSHRTDKLLQDAVDKANQISSRIVSNIRQRRLLGGGSEGGGSASPRSRTADGRVFLTLEQQPIPPELSRAVLASSNAGLKPKKPPQ